MKFFSSESGIKTHVLAIEPGEYDHGAHRAGRASATAVVSGTGTLDQCVMHILRLHE